MTVGAQDKQHIEIASIVFDPAIPGATIATAYTERHRIDPCVSLMAGELALNRLEFALTFNDEVVFSRVTQWQAYCVPEDTKCLIAVATAKLPFALLFMMIPWTTRLLTVSFLWPLGYLPISIVKCCRDGRPASRRPELNRQPSTYKVDALPIELRRRGLPDSNGRQTKLSLPGAAKCQYMRAGLKSQICCVSARRSSRFRPAPGVPGVPQ